MEGLFLIRRKRVSQRFFRRDVFRQFGFLKEVGGFHPAFTEKFFGLIVPVAGLGMIAFAERQDRE